MVRFGHDPWWQKASKKLPETSIGRQYYNREVITSPGVRWNILRDITTSKTLPGLYIHLRLGDRLGINRIETYIDILNKNHVSSKVSRCYIMYGIHNGNTCKSQKPEPIQKLHKCSEVFVEQLMAEIHDKVGIEPILLPGCTTDQDFVKLANAEYVIPGYGGFGFLAGGCNKNNVIWDICNQKKTSQSRPWRWCTNLYDGIYEQLLKDFNNI